MEIPSPEHRAPRSRRTGLRGAGPRPALTIAVTAGALALMAAAGPGCGGSGGEGRTDDGGPFVGARVITEATAAADLFDPALAGSTAIGRVGDVLMSNDRIRVVIQQPGLDVGLGPQGGTLIDAGRHDGPHGGKLDTFGELTPHFLIGASPEVDEVVVVERGGAGRASVVEARGRAGLFEFLDGRGILTVAAHLAGPAEGLVLDLVDRGLGRFSGPSIFFPDVSLDLRLTTRYRLEPGAASVEVTTVLENRSERALLVPVGDMVDSRGDLEWFAPASPGRPSPGFGVPFTAVVDWMGYHGEHLSYGYVPPRDPVSGEVDSQMIFMGGAVMLTTGSPSVLDLLLPDEAASPYPTVEPGASLAWTRHFVVGDGSIGAVADEVHRIRGIETGTLTGTVRERGTGLPLAGVRVSALEDGDPARAITQLVTDAGGVFTGTLPPGEYGLVALQGPDFSADNRPALLDPVPVTIAAGEATTASLALAPTGRLAVRIRDASGLADPAASLEGAPVLPGKLTVVGVDPTPPTIALVDVKEDGGRPGIVQAHWLLADATIEVEPGTYQLVVSRGPEYDVVSRRVTIAPGDNGVLEAGLTRVLDTAGWISTDPHLHQLASFDSQARDEARVRSLAAEQVEVVVPTDHDAVSDLAPALARTGAGAHMVQVIGNEITAPAFGHFNVWSIAHDPASRTGGALNHSVPSEVPVPLDGLALGGPIDRDGLTQPQMFEAVDQQHDGEQVLQISHPRAPVLGFFSAVQLDLSRVGTPAVVGLDPADVRLPDGAAQFELGSFTALEVLAGTDLASMAVVMNDWFGLLHLGERVAGTAVSDTHELIVRTAGYARTYVAVPEDDVSVLHARGPDGGPGFADAFARAINAQRLSGSLGLFVEATLRDDDAEGGGGGAASAGAGQLLSTTGAGGPLDGTAVLQVRVQAPTWAEYDRIAVFVNPPAIANPDETLAARVPGDLGPAAVLELGDGFERRRVTVGRSERFQTDVEVPIAVDRDAFVVVVVRGTEGRSRTLFPVVPTATISGPLEALLAREVPGSPRAIGFTNPVYLDVDGDGAWTPAGATAIGPAARAVAGTASPASISSREKAGALLLELIGSH